MRKNFNLPDNVEMYLKVNKSVKNTINLVLLQMYDPIDWKVLEDNKNKLKIVSDTFSIALEEKQNKVKVNEIANKIY